MDTVVAVLAYLDRNLLCFIGLYLEHVHRFRAATDVAATAAALTMIAAGTFCSRHAGHDRDDGHRHAAAARLAAAAGEQ